MIRKVNISNYKSVQELELELGRVNVFIGENGCGKTSILEAIVMGSAASQNKLDDEFLASRGVRVLESKLMKSAFNKANFGELITIGFHSNKNQYRIFHINKGDEINSEWKIELIDFSPTDFDEDIFFEKKVRPFFEKQRTNKETLLDDKKIKQLVFSLLEDYLKEHPDPQAVQPTISLFASFLIYAPENYFLRRFEEEGQIRPLGIRGEGLFKHLVELSKENPEIIKRIDEQLSLIDWFESLEIPKDLSFSERRINITDRYLQDTIKSFDQRSANEGFLYLLFYFTLFLSKYTPGFFAIDNIDNSLNPKLCTKLTKTINKLAFENEKQVILTTHNPAILDGLDLADDEQRLFVIYRNADGETTARRVMPPKEVKGVEPVRLSEAFVRGYLGGLPKNF